MTTKIGWTDETWNPLRGCTRVSEGCKNCYAERMAWRLSHNPKVGHLYAGTVEKRNGKPGWTGKITFDEKTLLMPLSWKKPRKIFVNSMGDLFHENVTDKQIDLVLAVIALCPQHTFQVLTKRPERMQGYLSDPALEKRLEQPAVELANSPCAVNFVEENLPLKNLHIGVSVEDQPTADARIHWLQRTPGVVRFVSYEPALGPVDFWGWLPNQDEEQDTSPHAIWRGELPGLDQIIMGGESGPGPDIRPMHPQWARDVRDQCQAAGTAFWFKQWGAWAPEGQGADEHARFTEDGEPWNEDEWWHFWPNSGGLASFRCGKKATGNLLDGVKWEQQPGEAGP